MKVGNEEFVLIADLPSIALFVVTIVLPIWWFVWLLLAKTLRKAVRLEIKFLSFSLTAELKDKANE